MRDTLSPPPATSLPPSLTHSDRSGFDTHFHPWQAGRQDLFLPLAFSPLSHSAFVRLVVHSTANRRPRPAIHSRRRRRRWRRRRRRRQRQRPYLAHQSKLSGPATRKIRECDDATTVDAIGGKEIEAKRRTDGRTNGGEKTERARERDDGS